MLQEGGGFGWRVDVYSVFLGYADWFHALKRGGCDVALAYCVGECGAEGAGDEGGGRGGEGGEPCAEVAGRDVCEDGGGECGIEAV